MRVLSLLLSLSACGLTRIENVSSQDAATDSTRVADMDSALDVPSADVPSADVLPSDALTPDAPTPDAPTGNCSPMVSACPNVSMTLEMGIPFAIRGAIVQGQADDVASACGGEGTSDWTIAVTAAEAGSLEIRFASEGRYGIQLLDGGCTGDSLICIASTFTQTSTGIDAGQTYLIVVEAVSGCDVPLDLTLTLVP